MQSDEDMAQERRHEASDIPASAIERAASLALSSCSGGRYRIGDGEGRRYMVLLVRKENKGA